MRCVKFKSDIYRLFFLLLAFSFCAFTADLAQASNNASIVVDANSGRVLEESSADAPRHPASLTKVMTLYLLFEALESGKLTLNSPLQISSNAAGMAPSKLGLDAGDTIKVEDAILAIVTRSANDVAAAIAENLAGSEHAFAERMTRKAHQIGMKNTHYENASGLPDSEQITTARDLALLGRAIYERFPQYAHYFATHSFVFDGERIGNHNKLLGRVAGVDGIKTGYTHASGYNLLTSVHLENRHLVAVVMGGVTGGQRDAKMRTLIASYLPLASRKKQADQQLMARLHTQDAPVLKLASQRDERKSAPFAKSQATFAEAAEMVEAMAEEDDAPAALAPVSPSHARLADIVGPAIAAAEDPQDEDEDQAREPAQLHDRQVMTASLPSVPAVITPNGEPAAEPLAASKLDKLAPSPARIAGWAVQIAAAGSESEAKKMLRDAQSKLKTKLAEAQPFTERVVKGSATLYRARFGFSDRNDADAACSALKRNDYACLTVRL